MSTTLIVALALGTRGDVQPGALVAWQLARHLAQRQPQPSASSTVSVTVVTHAAHSGWLEQLQVAFNDEHAKRQLQLLYISSLPAGTWHDMKQQQQQQGSNDQVPVPQGSGVAVMSLHLC